MNLDEKNSSFLLKLENFKKAASRLDEVIKTIQEHDENDFFSKWG